MKNKSKLVNGFIIGTFVSLYLMVSVISTIHVIDFFKLSNPTWLAVSLAIAFEVGAAASLASLIAMDKMNKSLVWFLFFLLTAMQAMGNTYYAFVNLGDYQSWSELFGLIEEEEIFQKRILSIVSGAILPIVALGFIKSLVDYIKPEEEKTTDDEDFSDLDVALNDGLEESGDISEPLIYDSSLDMLKPDTMDIPKVEKSDEKKDSLDEIQEINTDKKPISQDNIEVVNANSNKVRVKPNSVAQPENPDINPTRL